MIYQGEKYSGIITITDWQNNPLDANIFITRTLVHYMEDNTTMNQTEYSDPFIVLYSHESTGIYTFELNITVTGNIDLEITVTKPNMII